MDFRKKIPKSGEGCEEVTKVSFGVDGGGVSGRDSACFSLTLGKRNFEYSHVSNGLLFS